MQNKMCAAIAALAIAFVAAGCSSSSDSESGHSTTTATVAGAPVHTGIHGVVVPPGSQLSGAGDSVVAASPLDFEATSEWMGSHLPPDNIDGLTFHDAKRQSATLHQWCWQRPNGNTFDMLVISVSAKPAQVAVQNSTDDPAGC